MIASLRIPLTALLLAVLVGPAAAASDTPGLKTDHPQRYIVQKGDTLWDISGRFLDEPWRWPDVWQANPHIQNPHLIYPGDEVMLSYQDGRPIIRVRRRGGRGVVQLSPQVRAEPLAQAIPTIPVDAIQQFLVRPLVVTDAQFDAAPYIVSVGHEALLARTGGKIYARGIDAAGATRYGVYRKGQAYVDPANEGELLGFEALHVADAVLDAGGDPATLLVTGMKREVLAGDRLIAADTDDRYQAYLPRAAGASLNGQIISVVDGVSQIGQYQTVVINLGARDGIEPGHVFGVFQRGPLVEDPLAKDPQSAKYEARAREREERIQRDTPYAFVQGLGNAVESTSDLIGRETRRFELAITKDKPWAEVQLPEERAGTILIYRPFERLSYALVMEATRAMHVNDTIRTP
jgi:hypothetical protein